LKVLKSSKKSNPWIFVPTLFFMEGVPYVIVNMVAIVLFKKMGVPNGPLALWTSLISWPWMLKMFWGPLVDRYGTKRAWVAATQWCILASLALLCALSWSSSSWNILLVLLAFVALFSATHDIAADGLYVLSLDEKEQSFFVGIRSTAYRVAMIFGSGLLVYLAGIFENKGEPLSVVWTKTFGIALGVYAIGIFLRSWSTPQSPKDHPTEISLIKLDVFRDYFSQPKIGLILAFILFYRFGESMVSKMSAPFLIDSIEKGGLGLSTQEVGSIVGVVGVAGLTLGGIVGGITLSKYGLKRCLFPMVLSMNIPNLFYVWAAYTQPSVNAVYAIVGVDQFGYGFGFSAYMVYLMFLSQGSKNPTSHFAISTGLMALGAIAAGALSGYIEEAFSYTGFFIATLILSLPGLLVLRFLPLDQKDIPEKHFPVQLEL
jgi:PAT family beta-lactamase induction signal transducer AmpG